MKDLKQVFENVSSLNSNVIIDRRDHRSFIRQTTVKDDHSKSSHEQNSFETSFQFHSIQFIQSSTRSSARRSKDVIFDEIIVLRNSLTEQSNLIFQSSFSQFKRIDQFVFINQRSLSSQLNRIHQSAFINHSTMKIKMTEQKQRLIVLKQTSSRVKNKLDDFNDSLKSLIKNFKHRSSKDISFAFEN